MTTQNWLINSLILMTVISCLAVLGCGAGKDHCSSCRNDSECKSGECATFITKSGDKSLLCGNGSATGNDTCEVRQ